jgi:hypothetical protein
MGLDEPQEADIAIRFGAEQDLYDGRDHRFAFGPRSQNGLAKSSP